jgi:hypothetical protein
MDSLIETMQKLLRETMQTLKFYQAAFTFEDCQQLLEDLQPHLVWFAQT